MGGAITAYANRPRFYPKVDSIETWICITFEVIKFIDVKVISIWIFVQMGSYIYIWVWEIQKGHDDKVIFYREVRCISITDQMLLQF